MEHLLRVLVSISEIYNIWGFQKTGCDKLPWGGGSRGKSGPCPNDSYVEILDQMRVTGNQKAIFNSAFLGDLTPPLVIERWDQMCLPAKRKAIHTFSFLVLVDVIILAYSNISSPMFMKLYLINACHTKLCLTHFSVHWVTLTFKTYKLCI